MMFENLKASLIGELYFNDTVKDQSLKLVYATDASVYQEKPLAVAIPQNKQDLHQLIAFAKANNVSLIPRAAGTSLAGQVVGNGIVTDISKHFTNILELNYKEKWVRVQPGVIRDDLNAYLKPFGLMFGPETSTANRAMIGGMVGNNSSGLHSIIWGDTRQNLLELEVLLHDGSEVVLRELSLEELTQKCLQDNLEGTIYQKLKAILDDPKNKESIKTGFPKSSITRRNTGYALDQLLQMLDDNKIDLSKLIAGSEGTLCFITEIKLNLIDLPPAEAGMVAIHTSTLNDALRANLIALKHSCSSSELVDDVILELTKTNIEQSKNRTFIQGEPKAILMVEFFAETQEMLSGKLGQFIKALKKESLGYAHPILLGKELYKAWDLRKAGLGLLRNLPGDAQPVNLIEDCAVDPVDLPFYIAELQTLLTINGISFSMYAHAGAGELHVEPIINLKTSEGKNLFRKILAETVVLVKKYNGSLSGEHGDGRLRGEFIPFMMGEQNFKLFHEVKTIFDPSDIFNRGKIVNTPPMNEFLRYHADQPKPNITTTFSFSKQESILHLAEKCSGSGDCRKTQITGGIMCPSYMATRNEKDTTRARANMLRQYYTKPNANSKDMQEVKEILDFCLSCKGCKSECPSSVDITKMKAEFTQQFHEKFGISLRSRLVANFAGQMNLASLFPQIYNFIFSSELLKTKINKLIGFHPKRSMPLLHKQTVQSWWKQHQHHKVAKPLKTKTVYLFCDEFTNYNDAEIGKQAILLLEKLGYTVIIPQHIESGRSFLSKGLVKKAQKIAIKNVELLKDIITADTPLIGMEPSAILTFRDEYLDLVPQELHHHAGHIAKHTYLFEEWFARELIAGGITKNSFKQETRKINIHGHCHQKVLSSTSFAKTCLSVLDAEITEIPSGCCGMAGSFGYEAEHYDVSMQIGELVLFPAVRKAAQDELIIAAGTSCRHQIKDGTARKSWHPIEILYHNLKT